MKCQDSAEDRYRIKRDKDHEKMRKEFNTHLNDIRSNNLAHDELVEKIRRMAYLGELMSGLSVPVSY